MSKNLYADVTSSMIKMVQGFIQELTTPTFPIQHITLEAFADEKDLPNGDLIGFSGLELEVNSKIVNGKCMVGIIVENDENLFRLRSHVGEVFQRLLPESVIAVYDSLTGEVQGQMIVTDGSAIMPMGGKTGRPFQLIAFNWVTTIRYQPYEELGL